VLTTAILGKLSRISALALLLAALIAGVAGASRAAASPLYTATIEVTAQSASEERRALRAGLAAVLVKLSGQREVEDNPVVRRALAAPRDYTTSFGFVASDGGSRLRVDFAAAPIDELLRRAELPVWPAQRRPLLLWLLVDRLPLGRHWVDYNSDPDLVELIGAEMAARGMPWRLPDFDLRDRLAVADNRALLLDDEWLSGASERYQSVGEQRWAALRLVTNSEGAARGSWLQAFGDLRQGDELIAQPEQLQWQQWLHAAVDRVVAQEAYLPLREAGQLQLTIAAVGDMHNYRAVLAALATIEPLVAVELHGLDPSRLEMLATTEGSRAQVVSALLASGYFTAAPQPQLPESIAELLPATESGPIEMIWRGGRD